MSQTERLQDNSTAANDSPCCAAGDHLGAAQCLQGDRQRELAYMRAPHAYKPTNTHRHHKRERDDEQLQKRTRLRSADCGRRRNAASARIPHWRMRC